MDTVHKKIHQFSLGKKINSIAMKLRDMFYFIAFFLSFFFSFLQAKLLLQNEFNDTGLLSTQAKQISRLYECTWHHILTV